MNTAVYIAKTLGSVLLRVVHEGGQLPVSDIAFIDPHEEDVSASDLLLAVGVSDPDLLQEVVKKAASGGARD